MQRGRFAQEFLAELMREPRALRMAHLAERARWLRALQVHGREETLFELDLLLRALELAFERRHQSVDGRPLLGQDFSEELRAVRDAAHRATLLTRRLTAPAVERGLQFRAYIEHQVAEEARRSRLTEELLDQRTPAEGLYVLRHHLRALQGLADQLLRSPYVTYQAYGDLAVLGEQVILGNKYFRPPGALEFRSEYDRVGSVRLLDLVKRVSEARARKALALAFLSCFRLLRCLRYVPTLPVAAPRRAVLVALLVRDEAAAVASYLTTDLPRLTQAAGEAAEIREAAQEAAGFLRRAHADLTPALFARPMPRAALEQARVRLIEAAKAAAAALASAAEPGADAADLFDGQRARLERAEQLRRDLWLFGQLLRACLEELFPAMKGGPARAFEAVSTLLRFVRDFQHAGYFLLRSGDHEPFDRFFEALEALTHAAPSPARDRHLYLECRRFLTYVERSLALVSRRAELVGQDPDLDSYEAELAALRAAAASDAPLPVHALDPLGFTPPPPALVESVDDGARSLIDEAMSGLEPELELELTPLDDDDDDAPFNPDMTQRIWRGD